MDPTTVWRTIAVALEARLTAHNFDTWIKPVVAVGLSVEELTLCVPNQFHADWLSNHFTPLINETIQGELGHPLRFRIVVSAEPQPRPKAIASDTAANAPAGAAKPSASAETSPHRDAFTATAPAAAAQSHASPSSSSGGRRNTGSLNPRYTFEHFVVGHSNQFAHAACVSVGSNPGVSYNPLVIYGGVGLGKTHLLHGVGHQVLQDNPAARVCCVSSEQFMNEFIHSLSNNRIDAFRQKWRSDCDVLLIDDIQFIAGKDRTQEEFFHTFNSLHEAQKQIVLTCDKMPKEIPGLEARLMTRFNWGLIADIKAPDFETRVAIIKHKAEVERVDLPDAVAYMLAEKVASNVRELEGALTRLVAYSGFSGEQISPEFTRRVLNDVFQERRREISVEDIQRAVAQFYGMKTADLKSRRRHKAVVKPRQVAMYLCRQLTSASYPDIGSRFGGKDHSTVISAVRKIERLVDDDPAMRSAIDSIQRTLVS